MTAEQDLGLLLVAGLCTVTVALFVLSTAAVLLHLSRLRPLTPRERRLAPAAMALGLVALGCYLYAALVEVDRIGVTRLELRSARLRAGERLRVVQLTDLHVDCPTAVLEALPAMVRALAPDLVIFTGDALNDPQALSRFRALLRRLDARLGRFAVRGNFDLAQPGLFDGGVARELVGEPVVLDGGRVTLCGAPMGRGAAEAIRACLRRGGVGLRIVAHHTPDLVEELAGDGADLYLAGHTHGGQVRVPLYGAVITLSRFGKRYEMGRYQVGATTLVVSRGIGMEPAPAPRVRFLCPPEVVSITIVGQAR